MRFVLFTWSLLLGTTCAFVTRSPQFSSTLHRHFDDLHYYQQQRHRHQHQQRATTSVRLRDINERMAEQMGVPEVHSDNEWHPRDPARTTPQLLVALWHQITQAGRMGKGVRTHHMSHMPLSLAQYYNMGTHSCTHNSV